MNNPPPAPEAAALPDDGNWLDPEDPADQADPPPPPQPAAMNARDIAAIGAAIAANIPAAPPLDVAALGQAIGNAVAVNAPPPVGGANAGGLRKVPLFTEVHDVNAWKIWIRRFETVAQIANWNDQRMRRELAAGMGDAAAETTADIPIEDPADPAYTYDEMKDLYEARFISPAASDAARADFRTAKQGAEESLLEWHSRLRGLFLRSFPGEDVNGVGAPAQILRDQFITGIHTASVREYVWDQRPNTYVQALEHAQRKQATIQLQQSASTRARNDQRMAAIGAPTADSGASEGVNAIDVATAICHHCKKKGHFLKNCHLLNKARAFFERERQEQQQAERGANAIREKDENRPAAGRGRGGGRRGRGRGGKQNPPRVQSIGGGAQEEDTDATEEEKEQSEN